MNTNENPLENLEFFETFSSDDPIDVNPQYDPNKNIAPDIMAPDGTIKDPILDPEEDEDEDDLPELPNQISKQKTPPPLDPLKDDEDEDEPEEKQSTGLEDEDDNEDINYFEVFGKGLVKAGLLDAEDAENQEWTEETFLGKMSETIEKRAWDTLEELATETYGEAGVKLVEDIFINKVPIQQYLQMFNNEQIVDNVDLNNEGNQERVVRLYLAKTGMDEDEIEDQLTFAKDNDRLGSYAKKYHGKLVERMQQERNILAQENAQRVKEGQEKEQQRQQQYASVLEASIQKGEIEGYPINKTTAGDLFDFVLSKPHVLPNGQRITDFEYKLATMRQEDPSKFLAIARLVQNDLDLTPIKRKGVSEETNSIFNDLKTKTKKSTKSSKSEQDIFSRYFK
jgi:hypothetical protein